MEREHTEPHVDRRQASCVNQLPDVAFGILELLAPQLILKSGSLAGRIVHLRLTVLQGSKETSSWFLRPTIPVPGVPRIWEEDWRRFRLWRFGMQPLVHINVGWAGSDAEGGSSEESTQIQASFFRVPEVGTAEVLSLQIVLADGPQRDAKLNFPHLPPPSPPPTGLQRRGEE